ncbi:MAG: hypothetical protein R6U96_12365 [Promethearchaeia archaeon]
MADYYFEKNTGILMKSVTHIYEENKEEEDIWGNNTFTSILEEYADFTQGSEEPDETGFTALENYFKNNWLAVLLIIATLIAIGLAFWKIRHENIKRRYKAFKEAQMKKKINQEIEEEESYEAEL